tara:strand:+ start:1267 stop:1569 length:303 start_codon:yes stop_codon:yes gene_type:complete
MNFFLKTNDENKYIDDKLGVVISVHIINKILEDNGNYCLLETIYNNINKYAKKEKIILYKNDKYRNLNTYIKSKYKSVYIFLEKINKIYKIENDFLIRIS